MYDTLAIAGSFLLCAAFFLYFNIKSPRSNSRPITFVMTLFCSFTAVFFVFRASIEVL